MEEATRIGKAIKIPVILVGGMNSMATIESAMQQGFKFIQIGRALIQNTNFINELSTEVIQKSECTICNYCVAKMYSGKMECHLNQKNLPEELKQKIEALTYG
jgi:2,4-dienoyl-CoA reductase (NADPH2)